MGFRLKRALSILVLLALALPSPSSLASQKDDKKNATRERDKAQTEYDAAEAELASAKSNAESPGGGSCKVCFTKKEACEDAIEALDEKLEDDKGSGGDSPCGRIYLNGYAGVNSTSCKFYVDNCAWVKKQLADKEVKKATERFVAAKSKLSKAKADLDDVVNCVDCSVNDFQMREPTGFEKFGMFLQGVGVP